MTEASELRTVTVSEKGQVAIPIDIRRRLNIRKGQTLVLQVSDDKLLIAKSEEVSKRMRDEFEHLLRLSERSAGELWENEEDAGPGQRLSRGRWCWYPSRSSTYLKLNAVRCSSSRVGVTTVVLGTSSAAA